MIDCLPRLTHLDISGTNLAGTGVAMSSSNINNNQSNQNSANNPSLNKKLNDIVSDEEDENFYDADYFDCVSDIPGLSKRMRNPLEFLGLYGTLHSACQRHDIPAKVVSRNK